jgi:hypothetical protein
MIPISFSSLSISSQIQQAQGIGPAGFDYLIDLIT